MKTTEAIRWFKTTFHDSLAEAVAGTPFRVDFLAALAQQETGYIGSALVDQRLAVADVFKLCVGDTIDARYKDGKNVGRSPFPKDKAELLAHPQGARMFEIALHRAARDTLGKVMNPLQSQAGARNFNCAKGPREWWRGTRFADSAFWMHA